jgi:uncharacterized membrane protein
VTPASARPPVADSERRRVLVCFALGVVVGGVVAAIGDWELAVLVGWLVTAAALAAWVWWDVAGLDAEATAVVATLEDDSRTAARIVLVGASVVSLLAVAAGLRRAGQTGVGLATEVALTASSLASVIAAWLVVHTVFVLRYAHLYYAGDEPGGIDFPGTEQPTYRDFAYVAFTVGMTFQVSDTNITARSVRVTILRHALLSYLFGTAIIASTINVLASLIGR